MRESSRVFARSLARRKLIRKRGAPMRSVHDWFASYGADHQNPTNRLIHWICVPAILWSVIALLWIVPVPPSIGRPGFWCALLMVGALTFYWRLSRPLGAAMIALFIALALLTHFAVRRARPERAAVARDRRVRRRVDRPVRRAQDRRPATVVPHRPRLSADRAGVARGQGDAAARHRVLIARELTARRGFPRSGRCVRRGS